MSRVGQSTVLGRAARGVCRGRLCFQERWRDRRCFVRAGPNHNSEWSAQGKQGTKTSRRADQGKAKGPLGLEGGNAIDGEVECRVDMCCWRLCVCVSVGHSWRRGVTKVRWQ